MLEGVGNNSAGAAQQFGIETEAVHSGRTKNDAGAAGQPKFGDIWNKIQSQYGAKPEKPREIKKSLDKDDFMRIMITQMKHQDPSAPFKAEQFAAELAQYSTVEQLHNLNQTVGKLANQNQPLERLAMTNLIGKTVTVDRERFPHTENSKEALSFNLPRNASQVHALIISETGETVFEEDLGPLNSGNNSMAWDGKKMNTLPAKSGTYVLRIEAKDEGGQPIETNPQGKARVVGVSFEGTEPILLIGDPRRPDKVTMKNVVRIETTDLIPGAKSLAEASAAPAAAPKGIEPVTGGGKTNNIFTFQKGKGSNTPDPVALQPEQAEALARYESEVAAKRGAASANPVASATLPDSEKGFPNGLVDSDSMEGGEMK